MIFASGIMYDIVRNGNDIGSSPAQFSSLMAKWVWTALNPHAFFKGHPKKDRVRDE